MGWLVWCAVATGGAGGAVLRYGTTLLLTQWFTKAWLPYGVLSVNVAGSFLLGCCYVLVQNRVLNHDALKIGLTVGLLGALTTFSAFALDNVNLLLAGDFAKAGLNILLNVVLCILAVYAAFVLLRFA